MEFTRQNNIFNPDNQNSHILIVGAGSTGSFIGLTLAKMGFNNIEILDFDKVEEHNIPNQFYRKSDKDKLKVEALADIINDFTDTKIETKNLMIDSNNVSDLNINLNTIVVFCVDNMEARELIYNYIKDYPIKLVDTRMGGEGFSIHVIDMEMEEDKITYEKSLKLPIKETPCGEKAIIYTILSIASETANLIKRIDKGEDYAKIIKREMKTYRFIAK